MIKDDPLNYNNIKKTHIPMKFTGTGTGTLPWRELLY